MTAGQQNANLNFGLKPAPAPVPFSSASILSAAAVDSLIDDLA